MRAPVPMDGTNLVIVPATLILTGWLVGMMFPMISVTGQLVGLVLIGLLMGFGVRGYTDKLLVLVMTMLLLAMGGWLSNLT